MLAELERLMRACADAEILPRRPAPGQEQAFVEPWRAEVVTEADLAAEAFLTRELRALEALPVLGEESAKQDASRMNLAVEGGSYWLVDPIDGTSAFAAGREGFGIMVARVIEGRCDAAAILRPVHNRFAAGRRGEGCWLDGQRVRLDTAAPDPDAPWGGPLYLGFFSDEVQTQVRSRSLPLDPNRSAMDYAACVEYLALLEGRKDFVLYGRVLPWDHVPGSFLVEQAGGLTRHLGSGEPYRPSTGFGPVVCTAHEASYARLASALEGAFD